MQALLAERTGVLVVRIWVEGELPSGLRARVTRTLDVSSRDQRTTVVATTDEIEDAVRTWLAAFVDPMGAVV